MLSLHRHSGRLLPHHHTSYSGLTFLLMLAAVFLMTFSLSSRADTIYSRVTGQPPTQGAIILTPSDGQHFDYTPIQVTGTCPDNTYIKISRNGTFAGSTFCLPSHSFSIQVGLLAGANLLLAQDYDFADQAGPPTPGVTANLDHPNPIVEPNPLPIKPNLFTPPALASMSPFVITSTTSMQTGLTPGVPSTWQIVINGGHSPYALNWSWGDGSSSIYSSPTAGTFKATHVYNKPGNYTVIINASDVDGSSAFLQLGAQVNGVVVPAGPIGDGSLLIAWPLWLLAALMIASFWMGDKYKKAHAAPNVQSATSFID